MKAAESSDISSPNSGAQMETVGAQREPPFRRVFAIAAAGIGNRLGRSLVTLAGVALGVAFLMSAVTTQLIGKTVEEEREIRRIASLMENAIKSEVGSVRGKIVAIASFGAMRPEETELVKRVVAASPAEARGCGFEASGVRKAELGGIASGADVLLLVGDAKRCPVGADELTAGMARKLMLDSSAEREFEGTSAASARRELSFRNRENALKARSRADQERFRLVWIVSLSLCVTVIGVANALLMSVTERFREIGTMKCLGALSKSIRLMFLVESFLIGFAGSLLGVVCGGFLTMAAHGAIFSFGLVFGSMAYGWLALAGTACALAGTALATIAGLYPARVAARMIPASALRSAV